MMTALEYRSEVEKLHELARSTTDDTALQEIQLLILELERLARELGNGSAEAA
jgi:hypothetical protein